LLIIYSKENRLPAGLAGQAVGLLCFAFSYRLCFIFIYRLKPQGCFPSGHIEAFATLSDLAVEAG